MASKRAAERLAQFWTPCAVCLAVGGAFVSWNPSLFVFVFLSPCFSIKSAGAGVGEAGLLGSHSLRDGLFTTSTPQQTRAFRKASLYAPYLESLSGLHIEGKNERGEKGGGGGDSLWGRTEYACGA